MSESSSSINESNSNLEILAENSMDMENIPVMKSSGKWIFMRNDVSDWVLTNGSCYFCAFAEMTLSPSESNQGGAASKAAAAVAAMANTSSQPSSSNEAPVRFFRKSPQIENPDEINSLYCSNCSHQYWQNHGYKNWCEKSTQRSNLMRMLKRFYSRLLMISWKIP